MILAKLPKISGSLVRAFSGQPDLYICAVGSDIETIAPLIIPMKPDLIVICAEFEKGGMVELVEAMKEADPPPKLVMFSAHREEAGANNAIDSGPRGHVVEDESHLNIVHAVRWVLAGSSHRKRQLKGGVKAISRKEEWNQLDSLVNSLSAREREVFGFFGQGRTTKEIAQILRISAKTVDAHVSTIKKKLALHDRARFIRLSLYWQEFRN
jgi:RNA polymerase sigma factor (sigma-70 family)